MAIVFSTLYLFTALPIFLSNNSNAVQNMVLPLHLLAISCLIYVFYFDSKALAIAEKGEDVISNDYVLPLLLLFFSMIGIWLIQPRINRLYAQENRET